MPIYNPPELGTGTGTTGGLRRLMMRARDHVTGEPLWAGDGENRRPVFLTTLCTTIHRGRRIMMRVPGTGSGSWMYAGTGNLRRPVWEFAECTILPAPPVQGDCIVATCGGSRSTMPGWLDAYAVYREAGSPFQVRAVVPFRMTYDPDRDAWVGSLDVTIPDCATAGNPGGDWRTCVHLRCGALTLGWFMASVCQDLSFVGSSTCDSTFNPLIVDFVPAIFRCVPFMAYAAFGCHLGGVGGCNVHFYVHEPYSDAPITGTGTSTGSFEVLTPLNRSLMLRTSLASDRPVFLQACCPTGTGTGTGTSTGTGPEEGPGGSSIALFPPPGVLRGLARGPRLPEAGLSGPSRTDSPPEGRPDALASFSLRHCPPRGVFDWEARVGGSVEDRGSEPDRATARAKALEAVGASAGFASKRWAVGMTTAFDVADAWEAKAVPARTGYSRRPRRDDLLKRSIESVIRAGFPQPHLFVDGARGGFEGIVDGVTHRWPAVLTWGNWWLSLQELVIRNPHADRYAILQDDLVMPLHVRQYLDLVDFPGEREGDLRQPGYLNLMTFLENDLTLDWTVGWREAVVMDDPNWPPETRALRLQHGRGAVGLVFNRRSAAVMISSPIAARKCADVRPEYAHKRADGAVVTAMNHAGYREYVHNPSIIQHTGLESSMGNESHGLAESFPGEDFDCLNFLEVK